MIEVTNHHTGSFYAPYDPDIPPHLADQFQAYKLASARPDYVEFIGIETSREFWGQEAVQRLDEYHRLGRSDAVQVPG